MKFIIWDFDGTLAHRPTGWTGALLETLSELHPMHQIIADQLRPHLQAGFPWHVPEIVHPIG